MLARVSKQDQLLQNSLLDYLISKRGRMLTIYTCNRFAITASMLDLVSDVMINAA